MAKLIITLLALVCCLGCSDPTSDSTPEETKTSEAKSIDEAEQIPNKSKSGKGETSSVAAPEFDVDIYHILNNVISIERVIFSAAMLQNNYLRLGQSAMPEYHQSLESTQHLATDLQAEKTLKIKIHTNDQKVDKLDFTLITVQGVFRHLRFGVKLKWDLKNHDTAPPINEDLSRSPCSNCYFPPHYKFSENLNRWSKRLQFETDELHIILDSAHEDIREYTYHKNYKAIFLGIKTFNEFHIVAHEIGHHYLGAGHAEYGCHNFCTDCHFMSNDCVYTERVNSGISAADLIYRINKCENVDYCETCKEQNSNQVAKASMAKKQQIATYTEEFILNNVDHEYDFDKRNIDQYQAIANALGEKILDQGFYPYNEEEVEKHFEKEIIKFYRLGSDGQEPAQKDLAEYIYSKKISFQLSRVINVQKFNNSFDDYIQRNKIKPSKPNNLNERLNERINQLKIKLSYEK